jgi:uncharacterized protein (DUF2384 family)
MMSLDYDMIPPTTLLELAELLLAEIGEATALIATSETVPPQVAELIGRFDVLLSARQPEVGLAGVDPYLAEGLLGGAVVCMKALAAADPTFARREVRLGLEQVRQALRDIVDERPADADRPLAPTLRWLVTTVAAPQADLADLFGVSPRTLQRWLSESDPTGPSGDDAMRVRLVARVVAQLRHSFTGPGTLRWFLRPHPALDGRRPSELLDDVEEYPALFRLAARARSMVAT